MTDYNKFLTRMSYDIDDVSLMENFHESTKFFPSTMDVDLPRIVTYLTEHRALLETATNYKNYRYCNKQTLPEPVLCNTSVSECFTERRSIQRFRQQALTQAQLSNILHGAMRSTRRETLAGGYGYTLDKRTYASGGGLYPVEVYPLILNVEGMESCVTHYNQRTHELNIISSLDRHDALTALNDVDERLANAGVVFILTSVMERTTIKYGQRGYRFALLEAGEIGQNLSVCAVGENTGTLPWGGYYDDRIGDLLGIDNVSEIVVHCLSLGISNQEGDTVE